MVGLYHLGTVAEFCIRVGERLPAKVYTFPWVMGLRQSGYLYSDPISPTKPCPQPCPASLRHFCHLRFSYFEALAGSS